MAYALHALQQDSCGKNSKGVCPAMFPFNGTHFLVRWKICHKETQNQIEIKILAELYDECIIYLWARWRCCRI